VNLYIFKTESVKKHFSGDKFIFLKTSLYKILYLKIIKLRRTMIKNYYRNLKIQLKDQFGIRLVS